MAEEFVNDIIAQESIESSNTENTNDNVETNENVETNSTETNNAENSSGDSKSLSIEEIATQLGWNPNFQGEGAVDASTYILRSKDIQESMKNHNKDLKKQLSNLQGSVDALKEHNERVYRAEVKRMETEIATLKKQKLEAIELADVSKVEEIENQIEGIQSDIADVKKKDANNSQDSTNTVYAEWVKDNQWYVDDDVMAQYADTVAKQYEGAPIDRVFKLVTIKVKEVFPEKFEQSNNAVNDEIVGKKPIGPKSPVEGGNNLKKSNSFTKDDLTPDQQQIMRQFVQGGIMTEQQYINDIAKLQEA